jgi:hypothetical protein
MQSRKARPIPLVHRAYPKRAYSRRMRTLAEPPTLARGQVQRAMRRGDVASSAASAFTEKGGCARVARSLRRGPTLLINRHRNRGLRWPTCALQGAITRRLACHSALRLRTPLSSHRRGPWVDLSQHWGPPHGGAGVRPCLCANSNAARHVSHGWQRRHARRSIRRPSEWCAGMNGCDGQPTSPPIWIATSSLQVSHGGNVSHRQGIPRRHAARYPTAARHPTAARYLHPARRCALRGIAPMSESHARRSSLSVAQTISQHIRFGHGQPRPLARAHSQAFACRQHR